MGLLSDLLALVGGGDSASAELERMELEQVRQLAEKAEKGEADTPLGPKIRRRYHFVGAVQGVGFTGAASYSHCSVLGPATPSTLRRSSGA